MRPLISRTLFSFVCLLGGLAVACSSDDEKPGAPGGTGGNGSGGGGIGGAGGAPVEMDPCDDVECPDGSSCVASGTQTSCVCDTDDCDLTCAGDPCDENATCTDKSSGFSCRCNEGYSGNGFTCMEGDLCEDHICAGENTQCVTDGVTPICACLPGFEVSGDGIACSDIDECEDLSACGTGSDCINYEGGFVCDCREGYEPEDGACVDVAQCDSVTNPCTALGMECLDRPGGLTCSCKVGDYSDGTFCKSVPSCAADSCKNDGDCFEKEGNAFGCYCQHGTTGSACEDSLSCSADTVLNAESNPRIADATLRRYLENAAGIYDGSTLTVGDLHGVLEIDVSLLEEGEERVSSLAGLECLPELTTLLLRGQKVSDLGPLAHLNALNYVDLTCNAVTDISEFAGKMSIQELILDQDSTCPDAPVTLSSLTHLSGLKGLIFLSVVGQNISDGSAFDELALLEELNISDNPVDIVNEAGTLPSLRKLVAVRTDATNLSGMASFPEMRDLNLSDSDLSSLNGLLDAKELRRLVIDDLTLASLNGLSQSPSLREVRARASGITSLSSLAGSTTLITANFSNNSLTSISSLLDADPLEFSGELNVSDNPLMCSELTDRKKDLDAAAIYVKSTCE